MLFSSLKGHSGLLSLLEKNVLQHECEGVYLFTGPASVGKFTVAKQLARYLLCTGLIDDTCRCETCRLFPQVPDYFEISNGDENINTPDIDRLLEFVSLVPYRSHLRVAVVDNAHNINPTAASNLLKTLEDLKSNCIIILVSHHPDQLLPTVRSRCYQTEFGRLGTQDIIEILKMKGHDTSKLLEMERMIPYFTGNLLVDFGKYTEYVKLVPKFMKDICSMNEDDILSLVKEIDDKNEIPYFVEVLVIFAGDLLKIRYDSPDVIFNVKLLDYIEELSQQWKEDLCVLLLEKLHSVQAHMNRNINLKQGQFVMPIFSWLYYFMNKEKEQNGSK